MVSVSNLSFDTKNVISLPDEFEYLLPSVDGICKQYSARWNHKDPQSEVWKINHAGGEPIIVSEDTAQLLMKCRDMRRMTRGAFNILTNTAKSRIEQDEGISDAELLGLADSCMASDYRLEARELTMPAAATLDFGAIAKGAVCDILVQYLTEKNVPYALINLGGNTYAMGAKPEAESWEVGIRSPFAPPDKCFCAVSLRNASMSTSGGYERFLRFHGSAVHHIIDPHTGSPISNDLASVSVIGRPAYACDALSTAVSVMGFSEGQRFCIENGVTAIMVTNGGQVSFPPELEIHFV